MRISAGIEHHAVRPNFGIVERVDERTFAVGLHVFDLGVPLTGKQSQTIEDDVERDRTVDIGFASAQ